MNSFMSFGIRLACRRLDELDDPLFGVKSSIDWEAFRQLIDSINVLIEEGKKYYIKRYGIHIDIGTPEDLIRANAHYIKRKR